MLYIIVTFWSFCGKVLAKPYYCRQDGRFAKHCQTPLNHRFQLDLWCLQSERHFEAVTVKFSLNAITTLNHRFHLVISFFFMIVTFFSFYGEILAEPYYGPKDNQFPKHSQTPQNNPS